MAKFQGETNLSRPAFNRLLFMSKSSLLVVVVLWVISAAADTISGTVTNHTTGQPAVGDPVLLLKLGQGMQEEARTKTDNQGAFALNVSDANASYVVRVLHQGVNYDQGVTGAAQVDLKVYDAVTKIPGLSGKIGIVQIEGGDKALKVTEMFSIVNASTPPVTQASPHNFDIVLPGNANGISADVKGPGGIWVKVSPTAATGRTNTYSVNFPLRPGETLFKFNYQLPYKGAAALRLKLPYPIKGVGVVLPPSMSFKALAPGTFTEPVESNGLQLTKVVAEPVNSEIPPFEVSGTGAASLAAVPSQAAPPTVSAPPRAAAQSADGAGAANAAGRSKAELWLMIAGIVAILALAGFAVWRVKRNANAVPAQNASGLDALKEKLFQLESDRVRGAVSAEHYAAAKKALNESLQQLTTPNTRQ